MDAKNYVHVYRVRKLPRDGKVAEAIKVWAVKCEWPEWFAKNVVLWRRERGLVWAIEPEVRP